MYYYLFIDLKVTCGHPYVPLNTIVKLNLPNLEAGTVATYQCDEGYDTFGDTNITCSPSGQWIGEIPFCGESRTILLINVNRYLLLSNRQQNLTINYK